MIAWAALFWLIFITVRYVDTVRNAVTHPFNSGADMEWTWILVTLIAAKIATMLMWRAKALKVWIGAGFILSLAMVLASGAAREVACGVLLIVTAMVWGEWILTRFGKNIVSQLSPGETIVIAFSLGLAFLAFGGLALAIFGLLSSIGVWLLIAGLLIPQLGMSHHLLRRLPKLPADRITAILSLICGLVFLLNLMWALVPEIQFDANNYHLPVASHYVQQGRLADLPNFFHSYFVRMMDMIFALSLALGGPVTAKFIVLCSGIAAAAATYALGAALFGSAVALWACALFYTTALVAWLSGTAYVDAPLALFITASVLGFIKWHNTRSTAWLMITALLVGAAAATKLQALYILPGMVASELWLSRHHWSRAQASRYLAAMLIAVAVAAPWYVIIHGFTANPIFPMYNAWFKSPLWAFENTSFDADQFGMGTSLSGLLRLPFRLVFDTGRFGQGLPRGGLGIGILLLLPFGILTARRDNQTPVLLLICLSALAIWAFTFQADRYFVTILPMILCIGVAGLRSMSAIVQTCLMIVVAAQVVTATPQYWNIPERFPVFAAFGVETRESFLVRAIPGYESANFLNSVLEPDDRILGVETENLRFYLRGPLDSLAEATGPSPLHFISQRPPDEALARMLAVNGYRYLFVSLHSLEEAAPWYPFLNPGFLKQHAQAIHGDAGTRVFRLIGIPDDRSRRSSQPSTSLSQSSSQ